MSIPGDDERILELLSAAADDALSPEQRAELDRLSAASPHAGAFAASLQRLESLLARLPESEPPSSLHERILNSLPPPSPQAAKSQVARLFGWLMPPAPSSMLRYGVAAAAGILLTTVAYERQQQFAGPAEITELVGTMGPGELRRTATVLDSVGLDAGGLRGVAMLSRQDDALLLDIRTDAERPVTISVDLASAGMRVEAILQYRGGFESVVIENGVLTARIENRQQLAALLTRSGDAPADPRGVIGFELFDEDGLLQRGSLKPYQ